ncbi:glycosyltransferase family A protein [Microvirga sp. BSC39]|uniref:glycosyltransferase family A protein n=1 Tax=Microvirga sp. BSC39 TaxID=1549810 RepID=UPI0004E953D6|nr:glycosyltransferase family A protein [Microvirga sp. BSC39]KFG70316.1 hypothetical protein JH26_05335 [Microvirga sp. BSC39]
MTSVGVILPFYQREPGLLRQAVRSVLEQSLPDDVRLVIVVVDDESPCPSDDELASLPPLGRHSLVTLKRENGGPGAARNTGLDYFETTPVDFVAFLDTDDTWLPHHVADGIACLGKNADYFFANHRRDTYEGGRSYFDSNSTVKKWLRLGQGSPLEPTSNPQVFALRRDTQLLAFMQDYLSQTSTVIYRYEVLRDIRFEASLRTAGEDLLFWFSLCKVARRVVFTTEVGVICGSGVNIFHSTLTSWDHPNTPSRFAFQMMLWSYVDGRFELSPEEQAIVRSKIADFERGFSYIWLRALLKTGRANISLLRILRERLGWQPWRIIPSAAGAIRRRLARGQMFPEY